MDRNCKEEGMQHDSYHFPMQQNPHPPSAPYLETKKKCDGNAHEDKGVEVQN